MQEIRCPKCNEVFQVDDSGYSQIVQQVRDKEFEKEAQRRAAELENAKEKELQILKMQFEKDKENALTQKDNALTEKDKEIAGLRAKLDGSENEKQLAVSGAVRECENAFNEKSRKAQQALSEKDIEIEQLKAKLSRAQTEQTLAVEKASNAKELELSEKNNRIAQLEGELKNKDNEMALSCKAIEDKYVVELRNKDELIEQYKDFKARLSTKMVGETLEQHCLTQFNSIRMSAFPNAYFEKDNNAKSGSKGDFIFRESEDGIEFISIMFEMKNEMDTTATKHKNEDFFKELDKDRNEKGCEYAVLVSMLEADNEFYNAGIVDVSYKYSKMYVIRPQFFIPLISLLRNAARNSLEYKRELALAKAQEVDLTNFENNINEFKNAFSKNYQLASKKFNVAIEEIDKTIDHLQKTKDALLSSENNLRLANNKAEEQLSVKKLTKNAPSIREEFENIANRQSLPGAD